MLLGVYVSVLLCSNSMTGVTTLKTGSVLGDYETLFTAGISGMDTQ